MIQAGDVIDASACRNPDGQLYNPATRWGVRCLKFFGLDALPTRVSSMGVKVKRDALAHAARHGADPGMVAVVYRRSDGWVAAVFSNVGERSLDANSVRA